MNKFKIAMVVMAVVMVLSVTAVAFAQGTEPPATPTPPAAPSAQQKYGQTFWQTLAQKLGVSVEKLQQAVRDALKETVDKMLSDGKLTQQQADKAKAGIDKLPFDKAPFGQFLRGRLQRGAPVQPLFGKVALDAAAQKLGMTTQDLLAELRQGKTLADVAKEKNVNQDELKAALVAAATAHIDQAVKDGKLTQAQADKIKSNLDKQINLDMRFWGQNRGWPKGHPFFGGRGRRAPQPATP